MAEPALEHQQAVTAGLSSALERIGDRWSLLVVEALQDGPKRFGEISSAVPGLAPNILAARLRRLERDGLVVAVPYSQRPPRFEYQVTKEGGQLIGALRFLAHWGAQSNGQGDDGPQHQVCGAALEVRWYCPVCQRVTDGTEEDVWWV